MRCSCSAATAVNGLNVEPAAYGHMIARLNWGLRPLVWTYSRCPRTDLVRRLVNQFGLKFGYDAIATIAPEWTSMATSAPESAVPTWSIPQRSAFSAARWVLVSMVSRRLKPLTG